MKSHKSFSSSSKALLVNPLTSHVASTFNLIKGLNWKSIEAIPSFFMFFILSCILFLLCVFWVYGFFPMIASFIWSLVVDSFNNMKGKTHAERTPLMVIGGMYFLFYMPFFIICVPFFGIGMLGSFINSLIR